MFILLQEIRSQLDGKRLQVEQLLKLKRQTKTSDGNKTTTAEGKANHCAGSESRIV